VVTLASRTTGSRQCLECRVCRTLYAGIKAAASTISAWLADPTLDSQTSHELALMAKDPDGFGQLVPGLTVLAGVLAKDLAARTGRSTDAVLIMAMDAAETADPQSQPDS
jgi:hypothetical protein